MSDERRRQALRDYLRETLKGDRTLLIDKSGLSKGRIAQLLNPEQPFGEKAARELERRLGLPSEYLERRGRASVAPKPGALLYPDLTSEQREILRLCEPLFEDEKAALLDQLRAAHDNALKRIQEIRRRGLDKFVPDGQIPADWTRPAQRDLPSLPAPEPARTGKKPGKGK